MDTRFWGPSGWRFLHQISFAYQPERQKKSVRLLFEMLPFVLPCKFCRASLTEYMEADPLEPALQNKEKLAHWLYRIHNQVNNKLRKQGQPVDPDPSFKSVETYYSDSLSSGCTRVQFPGWTFLFSIAENHPLSRNSLNTSPMPEAPHRSPGMSIHDLNRYNLFKPQERLPLYRKFWRGVGESLPYEQWRTLWRQQENKQHLQAKTGARWSLLKALWNIRCEMEQAFELEGRTKFADLCDALAQHRSGCGKSTRAITCRKMRDKSRTKTLKR
jgi:hypothetical protein